MVSRYLVWIVPKIAVLNELDVLNCDIENINLMADCREQVWVVAGPEFGSKARKNMLEDFNIRGNNKEPPDVYLGAALSNMKLESVKVTYTDYLG